MGEPREGQYHLENLDLLLRLADEVGLKVIVQVYVDSAPKWVGAKYPEGRYAAQDGHPISSQAAPGFCFGERSGTTNLDSQPRLAPRFTDDTSPQSCIAIVVADTPRFSTKICFNCG